MIEVPRSRATIELPMIPANFDGDIVTLVCRSGPIRIEVEITYRQMEESLDAGDDKDWRDRDWINLRVPVRLV